MISKTFCPLPWFSVETSPNGSYKPCCVYTETIPKMHATSNSIEEAMFSPYMSNLRDRFRQGERPSQCRHCWAEEDSGKTSKRQYSIIKFQKNLENFKGDELEVSPIFLDLKLGNVCNIKCRICGSWSSSAWAPEEFKLFKNDRAFEMVREGQWPNNNQQFWNELEHLLPYIEYFEFTGGEPFLIKHHFRLLNNSVSMGHSNQQFIHYNTNGTIFPEDAIRLIWPHFKQVEVAFSIDDLADRFEYQRHPAKWSEVTANIVKFHETRTASKWLTTQVCITVSMFNILNLPNILDWAKLQHFDMIHINYLHGPDDFCVYQLPDNFKAAVEIAYALRPDLVGYLQPVINFMNSQKSTWSNRERLKKLKYHDDFRGESFAETFPREWELLNENT